MTRARGLELGKALSIAVVDYGGFVVIVERMDGARPMTPSIALSKACFLAVSGCDHHELHRRPLVRSVEIVSARARAAEPRRSTSKFADRSAALGSRAT
jgi:uncharacterized protein GlcG (DUF336 family)